MIRFQCTCVILAATVLVAGCSQVFSQSNQSIPPAQTAAPAPFSYEAYATILKRYVDSSGRVDYRSLQANSEPLKAFNQSLGQVTPVQFNQWSQPEQIAFLINAYNAFTLQSIIDQKPIKASIKDIPGVWRFRRFEVAGDSKTLDEIEHGTLRQNYREPRIHAALNCTAISCPPLRSEPYQANQLDQQLDQQVRQWLASSEGLRIDRDQNIVYLSAIFDWFGEDWIEAYKTDQFTGNEKQRASLNFVSNYVTEADRDYLKQATYRIKYLDYNWALNIQN